MHSMQRGKNPESKEEKRNITVLPNTLCMSQKRPPFYLQITLSKIN